MLVYNRSFSYNEPLNIVFLCGNKYERSNSRDKRKILKAYLEEKLPNCRVIILEEHFIFKNTNKRYLAYDDIFLSGLAEVEQLASLYADSIVIIHETISTAAELGMFAINPWISDKICLLVPDDISIDEKKITSFIKLAFLQKKASKTKVRNPIIFYPDLETARKSPEKSDYITFFHNDEIGEFLGNKLISFVNNDSIDKKIEFAKCQFGKPASKEHTISYYVDHENNIIDVYVSINILKIQLLTMFYVDEFRKEFRKAKALKDHVTFICNAYKTIVLNTIIGIEGIDSKSLTVDVSIRETKICTLRQAIGYYIYMLQAIGWIHLELQKGANLSCRKISIAQELDAYRNEFSNLIVLKSATAFEELGI